MVFVPRCREENQNRDEARNLFYTYHVVCIFFYSCVERHELRFGLRFPVNAQSVNETLEGANLSVCTSR